MEGGYEKFWSIKKSVIISNDFYFGSGFSSLVEKSGGFCKHLTLNDLPLIKGFDGTILIDVNSFFMLEGRRDFSFVFSELKEMGAVLVVSCPVQGEIIDLIFGSFINVNRKASLKSIRESLSASKKNNSEERNKTLTKRERQILIMRVSGMGVRNISKELGVNFKTLF